MTNTNPLAKIDFSLLEGLEPGTDEFGIANLKIVMDFSVQVVEEITWLAAVAHDKGQVDTPVIGSENLLRLIAEELMEQSVHHAEMFMASFEQLWPEIVKFYLQNHKAAYITSDNGLWVDIEELKAMTEEAEATA